MRVLALVTEAFGGRGGIAQYNRDLLRALAACPATETLRVLPRIAVDRADVPAGLSQLPARPSRGAYSSAAMIAAARLSPDVVLCGHLFMAPLAIAIARTHGARVWLHLHGIEAWQRPSGPRAWAAERCQLITCVSRHTRSRVLEWCDVGPQRVRVLSDTVEARFSPGPRDAALAARLGLAAGPVVLTVGRLAASERYKGHDRVLRCLPQLVARHPAITYAIAGAGDDQARLVHLARELGLSDHVRFLGYVADDDLPGLYRLADVFAMPSTGEGFGIVYVQALASGTPVVASTADASADPLWDGALGRRVDPRSVDALADAIENSFGTRVASGAADSFRFAPFSRAACALLEALGAGRFEPSVSA